MDRRFDLGALETLLQWRFEPGIRNGRPVRSGFRLHLKSDFRNDTLPARLEWTYKEGVNEDSLTGTWIVEAPPPPYTTEQLDSTYAGLLRQLVAMKVIRPGERRPWDLHPYCLVLESGDSVAHARLAQLANSILYPRPAGVVMYHGPQQRLAPYACERNPSALRIVLPRVHRTESHRAVLQPSGDYLRDWPPGFEGRTYRTWSSRCVADVPPSGTVHVGCWIYGDAGPEEEHREQRSTTGATQPDPPSGDSILLTVVAMTRGAFQKDTLRTRVAEAAPLSTRAVRDPKPPCGAWAAYSQQASGKLYIIKGDLEGASLTIARVTTGRSPADFRASACGAQDVRYSELVAFLLGDLGDPIRSPIVLCYGVPDCTRPYLLDPARHTLARKAHLRFKISDLRPETRVGDQLVFRIYTDRALPNLLPFVLIQSGDHWHASFPRRINTQEWEHGVTFGDGYKPDTEVRVYLLVK
jgi:hypothetical protein